MIAGVVDQDVDAAERVDGGLRHRHRSTPATARRPTRRRPGDPCTPDRPRLRRGRVASRSATTTDGARLAQRLGVHDTDAAGAAGDHRHLAGQIEQFCSCHALDKTTTMRSSQVACNLSRLPATAAIPEGERHDDQIARCREVHLHIGDERRTTGGGGVYEHVFPATGEVQGPVPLAGPADVDDAVERRAATRSRRGGHGHRGSAEMCSSASAELLDEARDELARLSVLDNGMTYGIAQFTATSVVDYTRYYAGWADKIEGRVTSSPAHGRELAYTAPEPYGVIGIIITWNGPLVSIGMKVIPALAAGNTVVVKPSELTPYATEHFMDPRRARPASPPAS